MSKFTQVSNIAFIQKDYCHKFQQNALTYKMTLDSTKQAVWSKH
jgi:hypothetical protein